MNIPKSVKEIVLCAFTGTSIKDIFMASDDPDKRTDLIEALRGLRLRNITLHVPKESIYKYNGHPIFREFRTSSKIVAYVFLEYFFAGYQNDDLLFYWELYTC